MLKVTLSYLLNRKMRDYGFGSREAFAEYLGMNTDHLGKYLAGSAFSPGCETKRKFCSKLDIRTSVLEAAIRQSAKVYGGGGAVDE